MVQGMLGIMIRRLSSTTLRKRRVLVRVDVNVPIAGSRVTGDFRIRAHLPTIRLLLKGGNTLVLLAHHSTDGQTLAPVARRLSRLIGEPVGFLKDPAHPGMLQHRVMLAENLRRWRGEEAAGRAFARMLARLGDAFVNDAFAVAHRHAASTAILPKLLPSYIGPLFAEEIAELDRILQRPKRPLVAVFGGAKLETKLKLLQRFDALADRVLVGGSIANALLIARGTAIADPRARKEVTAAVRALARSRRIVLPIDAAVATAPTDRRIAVRSIADIRRGEGMYDIGPETVRLFAKEIGGAKTIIWNGPLGMTEIAAFRAGTLAVAKAIARSRGRSTVGGGDTIAWLEAEGLAKKFNYVSTGGGAMLAYLAGEKLPALEALKRS
ncbi:phosphoglycerate kinase [Candidatus Parcubacteria bacterium]|nr:MAG: phosphoglycerate kinase [Candidatus Parcubacteria bacterium]